MSREELMPRARGPAAAAALTSPRRRVPTSNPPHERSSSTSAPAPASRRRPASARTSRRCSRAVSRVATSASTSTARTSLPRVHGVPGGGARARRGRLLRRALGREPRSPDMERRAGRGPFEFCAGLVGIGARRAPVRGRARGQRRGGLDRPRCSARSARRSGWLAVGGLVERVRARLERGPGGAPDRLRRRRRAPPRGDRRSSCRRWRSSPSPASSCCSSAAGGARARSTRV